MLAGGLSQTIQDQALFRYSLLLFAESPGGVLQFNGFEVNLLAQPEQPQFHRRYCNQILKIEFSFMML